MAGFKDVSNLAKCGITSILFVTFFTCLYHRDIFLSGCCKRLLHTTNRLCPRCLVERSKDDLKTLDKQLYVKRRDVIDDSRSARSDKHFKKRLPNTLIIGVKKGGTKALLVFLEAHPKIRASKKEVHFFDNEHHYHSGVQWYKNKMPKSYSDQIILEKSPRYFVNGRVPKRVFKMSSKMKIILILRDPVKRAISDYVHMKTRRKCFINEDIESILWNNKTGKFNGSARFMQAGLYSVYIKNWLRYFPRDQIHIVNGDNLIHDPGMELMKVQRFLGIEVLINRSDFVFNPSKQFYCLTNRPYFNSGTHEDTICLGPSKGRKHPHISQRTLQAMRDFYRPYNQELYDLVGMDFGW